MEILQLPWLWWMERSASSRGFCFALTHVVDCVGTVSDFLCTWQTGRSVYVYAWWSVHVFVCVYTTGCQVIIAHLSTKCNAPFLTPWLNSINSFSFYFYIQACGYCICLLFASSSTHKCTDKWGRVTVLTCFLGQRPHSHLDSYYQHTCITYQRTTLLQVYCL